MKKGILCDIYIAEKESKTPQDKRTNKYKILAKQVKEMKRPFYKTQFGIWAYLRVRDMNDFTNNFNENNSLNS